MKAKLLTLVLFGILSLTFASCNKEEVVPAQDVSSVQATADCECEGGLSDRERPK